MGNLTTNFNRLALYLAYKAGTLTWQQLPLTTQVQCVRASAAASHVAYGATLTPKATYWCARTHARTGGVWLTGTALQTVANTAKTANMRKVA